MILFIQFFYPSVLWALFALIIPIIIHLFSFRRFKTVYFSNISFLNSLKSESKSKRKIKNILLLLTRILLFALLIIAFAKPYIPYDQKPIEKNVAVKALILRLGIWLLASNMLYNSVSLSPNLEQETKRKDKSTSSIP